VTTEKLIQIAVARVDLWLCTVWAYVKIALCADVVAVLLHGTIKREDKP